MNKKYLSLIALAALLIMAGGLLSGCGNQSSQDDSTGLLDENTAPTTETAITQPPVETVAAPVITDAELDQELKNIDAELDTVKITGFEASNLADKDLGI